MNGQVKRYCRVFNVKGLKFKTSVSSRRDEKWEIMNTNVFGISLIKLVSPTGVRYDQVDLRGYKR